MDDVELKLVKSESFSAKCTLCGHDIEKWNFLYIQHIISGKPLFNGIMHNTTMPFCVKCVQRVGKKEINNILKTYHRKIQEIKRQTIYEIRSANGSTKN